MSKKDYSAIVVIFVVIAVLLSGIGLFSIASAATVVPEVVRRGFIPSVPVPTDNTLNINGSDDPEDLDSSVINLSQDQQATKARVVNGVIILE